MNIKSLNTNILHFIGKQNITTALFARSRVDEPLSFSRRSAINIQIKLYYTVYSGNYTGIN